MNNFEKVILYVFSFLFFPIGVIMWIISLFKQDLQMKKIGRTALYVAIVSFSIQIAVGVVNFVLV